MKRALAGLAVFFALAWTSPAQALLCTFTPGNLVFIDAEILEAGSDAQMTIGVNCTGVAFTTTRICMSLNAGSGGADTLGRYMTGPGGTLRYQLYTDAARSTIWGSTTWGLPGGPRMLDVTYPLSGSVSTSVTVYGRIFAPQATAAPGNYASAFGAGQVSFAYFTPALLDCTAGLGLPPLFATPSFNVTANVVGHCLVNADNINFGTRGPLNTATDADGQVSVTCTKDTTYQVALDGGTALAAPTARKMKKGAETITYGLYRDAARSQPWGQTLGVDMASGTGNGVAQNLPVHGRVPAQTTPTSGTYTDTIVVTVTY